MAKETSGPIFWLRCKRWVLADNLTRRWPDKLARWVAWHLHHEVVKWCMVRVAAHVWQDNVEPDRITYPMMATTWDARWDKPPGPPEGEAIISLDAHEGLPFATL